MVEREDGILRAAAATVRKRRLAQDVRSPGAAMTMPSTLSVGWFADRAHSAEKFEKTRSTKTIAQV